MGEKHTKERDPTGRMTGRRLEHGEMDGWIGGGGGGGGEETGRR